MILFSLALGQVSVAAYQRIYDRNQSVVQYTAVPARAIDWVITFLVPLIRLQFSSSLCAKTTKRIIMVRACYFLEVPF